MPDPRFNGSASFDGVWLRVEGTVKYPNDWSTASLEPRSWPAPGERVLELDLRFNRDREPFCDANLIGPVVFERVEQRDEPLPDSVDTVRVHLLDGDVVELALAHSERQGEQRFT